jgi:electron transfer flavoprotein beta subunit
MKIVVCVKEVVDVSFPFVLDQETFKPLEEDVFYTVNPADRCAVEVALTMQEQYGGEVCFLTFGPRRAEKTLRGCLALGGDRAVRVWDDRIDAGSQAIAFLLARAVAQLSPDLVLCGSRSLDEGSGETPAAMAEFLGFPQVVGVTDLEFFPACGTAVVQRKLEMGRRESVECPLPAVIAVEAGIRQPRYAALPRLLEASRAQISLLNGAELGIDSSEVTKLDSLRTVVRRSMPRPRPKKTFTMESGLSAEQRMAAMMSGAARQGKSDLLEGPPEDIAGKLTAILQEKVFTRT